jgi:uncharacterized phiE125 gp8 family phage protein
MNLRLKTSPTAEPVSVDEFRVYARIDADEDDGLILSCIQSARERAELVSGRAIMTQTWELRLDGFRDEIVLPNPPLVSATIAYLDSSGVSQALATSVYTVDTYQTPGRILLAYGQSWPSTRCVENAVTITFVCGYGATWDNVPAGLRLAIQRLALYTYQRDAVEGAATLGGITAGADAADAVFRTFHHGYQF